MYIFAGRCKDGGCSSSSSWGAPRGPLGGVLGMGGAPSLITHTHHHSQRHVQLGPSVAKFVFKTNIWNLIELFLFLPHFSGNFSGEVLSIHEGVCVQVMWE